MTRSAVNRPVNLIGASGRWGRKIKRTLQRDIRAVVHSYDEFTGFSDLNPVFDTILATPSDLHFEHAVELMKMGVKNLYIEKPACKTREELDTLLEMSDEFNVRIAVGTQYSYAYMRLKRVTNIIKNQYPHFQNEKQQVQTVITQRANTTPSRTDSDILENLWIHDLSIMRPYSVSVDGIDLYGGRKDYNSRISIYGKAELTYDRYANFNTFLSYDWPEKLRKTYIIYNHGTLLIDESFNEWQFVVDPKNKEVSEDAGQIGGDWKPAHEYELLHISLNCFLLEVDEPQAVHLDQTKVYLDAFDQVKNLVMIEQLSQPNPIIR